MIVAANVFIVLCGLLLGVIMAEFLILSKTRALLFLSVCFALAFVVFYEGFWSRNR